MIHFTPRRGHSRTPRRVAGIAATALLCLLLPAIAAQADTSSTLTVVGTSDVSDSGLIPNLIQPAFEAAYPQFTFKYIGTATGTAITDAETGSVGASVLIVHAASLENQFVAGGYSYEKYGRALFTNDFVLAGPTGDPAGVAANGANNIVQAFEDVATAGYNGGGTPKVSFISRGGTPGTTVEEHAIWALVAANNPPAGLLLCAVNATNGGGDTPIAPGNGVTSNGQPCPNSGALPSASALPSWYVVTGATQGPNVQDANACSAYQSPTGNSCYVFTDRGTYDYLSSGQDAAGTIPNLKIVTRGPQPASAPGGTYLLVNYFHGYIINPSQTVEGGSTPEPVNLTAAQDFLNFLTSPAIQSKLSTYLPTADPAGPPFVADASPKLTVSSIPRNVTGGSSVTLSGTLTNAETGYPVLSFEPVTLDEVVGGVPVAVAHATTDANGNYKITFKPGATGSYEIATSQIAEIENATLNPIYGDLLSPAATAASTITVHGQAKLTSVRLAHGRITVSGTVGPAAPDSHASVTVLARHGSHGAFKKIGTAKLRHGASKFSVSARLKTGAWQVKATYQDNRVFATGTSKSRSLTVSAHKVSFKR